MEKISKLKKICKKNGIDGYLIPKNNEYFGEYIEKKDDRLNYISNFSGSSGLALILESKNYLFVDGRYTLQARIESGRHFDIKTFPVELPSKFLKKNLKIGFDPKLFTSKNFNFFFGGAKSKFLPLKINLIDKVWKRKKIQNKKSNFYHMPVNSVGQSSKAKIMQINSFIKKKGADFYLVTASENSAWLLNIRGRDSEYTPIPNCIVLLEKNTKKTIFCDLKKTSVNFRKKFKNTFFKEIVDLKNYLSKIENKKFIIDRNTCSIFYESLISKKNQIVCKNDPIYFLKSIKNSTEIRNIKKAHVLDGAALTKYLIWIKNNYKKTKITEISGEKKLLKLRKKYKSFKYSSFPTISGTGSNGAIIHYRASKKTNKRLKKGQIYLVDSGGQYNFGTTDVTRTISLDNNNKRVKKIFTNILKGHIAVTTYKINNKTNGSFVDLAARKYLKEMNLNYAHGTGHGVGYFLNVHEGPQAISGKNKVLLEEGMVLSNEPGYYEQGKFGMRLENLIYVKKIRQKKIFDNLTLAPIDKNLIDRKLLKKKEINWINGYHKTVFNKLNKFMSVSERLELKKACSAI